MTCVNLFDRMAPLNASASNASPVHGLSVQKRNRLHYQTSAAKSAMVSVNAITNHELKFRSHFLSIIYNFIFIPLHEFPTSSFKLQTHILVMNFRSCLSL